MTGIRTTRLRLNAPNLDAFIAGQYVLAKHPNGTEIPLSIASSPSDRPMLELHYRSTPGDPLATAFDELINEDIIEFGQPQGSVHCPDDGHLLIVAGGTGAAVAFSCSRYRATLKPIPTTTILWCADEEDDFYDHHLIKLAPEIHLETIADDRRDSQNKGLAWLREGAHVSTFDQVIISGGPPFVYTVTDILLENGFSQDQLLSDVYDYAPR